jgi:SAM-dependent methyltransferase
MREDVRHETAAVEDRHWWFRGRRRIVARWLERLPSGADRRILEIGCGSGGNLPLLARHGRVDALDTDETALGYARARGCAEVRAGSLPHDLPYAPESFDLVVMLDVLEHVDDDAASLRAARGLLKPGGAALVTVPAHRFLWSAHDDAHDHRRRYGRDELRDLARGARLSIRYLSHFNAALFLPIAAVRLLTRGGAGSTGLQVPPAPLNDLLAGLLGAERHLMPALTLPWGVSLLLVGHRDG